MNRRIISWILVFMLLFTLAPVMSFAAEDNTAPELKSIKILDTSIKAGEDIKVQITVREDGTGLKKAFIQFNSDESNQRMLSVEKIWSKPQYSSASKNITYTFTVPTETSTRSGKWFIGYLEFYDSKGNFSRYYGNPQNNQMEVEEFSDGHPVTGTVHVTVSGTKGDVYEPVINWVKVLTPVVEKPSNLKVQVNITEASALGFVQFNLSKVGSSVKIIKNNFSIPYYKGTKTYTFEIPISEKRHNGEWEISDIYLSDNKNNDAHYTTQIKKGYFVNYYNPSKAMSIPKFKVIGVYGDESAPTVTSIEVLNSNSELQKPGQLKLRVGLNEEESGITNLELEIECISSEHIDVKSRKIYRFSAKGYSYKEKGMASSDIQEWTFDKPLMTGQHEFTVPIPSTVQNGTYEVYVREVIDRADNIYENYADQDVSAVFSVSDEFDYDFESSISNDNLLSRVENMEVGKVGRILLSNSKYENILSKEILHAIAGQDKTLICYKDGYQWIIRGKDIDSAKIKDINLTTRIYTISKDYLSSGKQAVCLSFENNGELPGKLEFRFKSSFVKNYYRNENRLYLYHVDGRTSGSETNIDYINDDYEQVPSKDVNFKVVIDEGDAWCYLDLSHNSKYVVSDAKIQDLTMSNAKVTGYSSAYTYNGKYKKPTLKVTIAGKALKANKDYTVTYKSNKSVGTATATIAGKGTYKSLGFKKISFRINPKGTSISKLSKGNNSFKVKWKKQKSKMASSRITGYQVRYSTSSKMISAKTVTIKGYSKTSKTIKKLKNKKTYYVQVRTYKGKYYSSWSKTKKVKTR